MRAALPVPVIYFRSLSDQAAPPTVLGRAAPATGRTLPSSGELNRSWSLNVSSKPLLSSVSQAWGLLAAGGPRKLMPDKGSPPALLLDAKLTLPVGLES